MLSGPRLACQADNRGLARDVVEHERDAPEERAGRDVHDLPGALLPQVRHDGTAHRNTPPTLPSRTRFHSSSAISANGFIFNVAKIAALLTRMSMRPNCDATASTIRTASVSEETS